MQLLGSSKITYYSEAIEKVVTQLLGEDREDLIIKFDSRANVKGSYGKFIPANGSKPAEIRIYTGAIVSQTSDTMWEDLFVAGTDPIESASDALLFVLIFLLKKYLRGTAFEMKTSELNPTNNSPLKSEPDYVDVSSNFETVKTFYNQIISSSPAFNLSSVTPEENLNDTVLDVSNSEDI